MSSVSNSDEEEEKKEVVNSHTPVGFQEIIEDDSFSLNPQVKTVQNFGHQHRSNLKRKADEVLRKKPDYRPQSTKNTTPDPM